LIVDAAGSLKSRPKLKAAAANLLSPARIPFIGVGFSGPLCEREPRHPPVDDIAFSLRELMDQ
jgi:hypothetical protein